MLQFAGLILLAVLWLPARVIGPVDGVRPGCGGPANRTHRTETAYTVCPPTQAVQFHQFRLPGAFATTAKVPTLDSLIPLPRAAADLARIVGGLSSGVPSARLNCWRFRCRTAGSPRAPCPA